MEKIKTFCNENKKIALGIIITIITALCGFCALVIRHDEKISNNEKQITNIAEDIKDIKKDIRNILIFVKSKP